MYYFYDIISGVLSCVLGIDLAAFRDEFPSATRITQAKYDELQHELCKVEEVFNQPT